VVLFSGLAVSLSLRLAESIPVDQIKLTAGVVMQYSGYSRPVAILLIMGGRFPRILDLFQGLKIGVPSGCLAETSIFKIAMTGDITLWSKLESTW